MKTQVFVLISYDVPAADIGAYVQCLLEPHRFDDETPEDRGHFDYLVGALSKSFNDPAVEYRLPPDLRPDYAGNICDRANLPPDAIPGALVTPDGQWHDLSDFGWRMLKEPSNENREALDRWTARYRELIASYENCWVVEVWAHS